MDSKLILFNFFRMNEILNVLNEFDFKKKDSNSIVSLNQAETNEDEMEHEPSQNISSIFLFDFNSSVIEYNENEINKIIKNNLDLSNGYELFKKKYEFILDLDDLKNRGKFVDEILNIQFSKDKVNFIMLPNICVGSIQENRFKFENDLNSILLCRRKETEKYMKKLEMNKCIDIFGNVGIGKSYILYEMACLYKKQRDKYRVIYVNNSNLAKFIDQIIECFAFALYEDPDELNLLKKAKKEENPEKKIKFLISCIDNLKSRELNVITIIDQTNNLYNKASSTNLSINEYFLQILKINTWLITSGSANNEMQFQKSFSQNQYRPPIKLSKNEMKLIISKKYKHIKTLDDNELDKCYYITNGILLQIDQLFQQSDEEMDIETRIYQYKEDYFGKFISSHKYWLSKDENEKKEKIRITSECIISYFYNSSLDKGYIFSKNPSIDWNFFYIESNKNKNFAKFLTPLGIDIVLVNYTFNDLLININKVLDTLVKTEYPNTGQGLLFEFYLIKTIQLKSLFTEYPKFKFKVHKMPINTNQSIELSFENYVVETFDEFPSINNLPINNTLFIPRKSNNKGKQINIKINTSF
jgi:hypothetical protein